MLLGFNDALKEFGGVIRASTLRAWIFQKKIPVVKLGGKVALKKEDIHKFIERGYSG